MHLPNLHITNQWILSKRGEKNAVDPDKPYAFHAEQERTSAGNIEDVATIFLTNKECPFTCLMCDLWKNTTGETVPIGSIPRQIEYALRQLPPTRHIKLYNSGNFFDPKAIPQKDYDAIAQLLHGFDTVLVENHPRLVNRKVVEFRDKLKADLQVAMGLETVHPEVMQKLNKKMSLKDFSTAVGFLGKHDIMSRSFILLRPPFLLEAEGVEWAKRSIDFSFDAGVECCAVIPTRAGNGALEYLEKEGFFHSPNIRSLEVVQEYGIGMARGRVFADLWDLEQFAGCDQCFEKRKLRMHQMNLEQVVAPEIICNCPAS